MALGARQAHRNFSFKWKSNFVLYNVCVRMCVCACVCLACIEFGVCARARAVNRLDYARGKYEYLAGATHTHTRRGILARECEYCNSVALPLSLLAALLLLHCFVRLLLCTAHRSQTKAMPTPRQNQIHTEPPHFTECDLIAMRAQATVALSPRVRLI